MAINFRLAYNQGIDYVDLFPRSSMEAVIDSDNILQYTTINVNIPVPTGTPTTQTITIATTQAQVDSPVAMQLITTGEQAEQDYSTITQFEVQNNALVITRLYNWPQQAIDVELVFQQKGV